MTDTDDPSEHASQQDQLLYVDVDESDPFESVSLSVVEDDTSLRVGTVDAEPGRYVLVREQEGDCDE